MSGQIVAATDFSARADRAVDRAILLGQSLGRKVTLVHALEFLPDREIDTSALDKQMQAVIPDTSAELNFAYPEGVVPEAIANYADGVEASMIVIGVARHNSVGDYILGTAVDRVIRSCGKPVVVVKKRPKSAYKKILVPTDFSAPSQEAIDWAAETFPDAEIHLLNVWHVPFEGWNKAPYVAKEIEKEARDRLATMLDEMPVELTERLGTHVMKGNLSGAVNSLIDKLEIDLVVVGSQGETGFRHATIGSRAIEVLESSMADTVVVGPRVN